MPVQISPLLMLPASLTSAQGARDVSLGEGIFCACFSLLALLKPIFPKCICSGAICVYADSTKLLCSWKIVCVIPDEC